MSDDAELLARLKAAADEAWLHSANLAKLAGTGLRRPEEWQEALRKAQEASMRYQAFLPEVPNA